MSKIGIKPDDRVVGKGIIRLQKLVDELRRENDLLKARLTSSESANDLLTTRVQTLEDA